MELVISMSCEELEYYFKVNKWYSSQRCKLYLSKLSHRDQEDIINNTKTLVNTFFEYKNATLNSVQQ